jgi:hypothetical protein
MCHECVGKAHERSEDGGYLRFSRSIERLRVPRTVCAFKASRTFPLVNIHIDDKVCGRGEV